MTFDEKVIEILPADTDSAQAFARLLTRITPNHACLWLRGLDGKIVHMYRVVAGGIKA